MEEIVWTCGKHAEIITDNGQEFISDEAECHRYGIVHKMTSPGQLQTNGKVERLNHESIQRLQRISAENGHCREVWDLYIRQAIFAFHAHINRHLSASPFSLQYGVEPVLPSTSIQTTPVSRSELSKASEHRKQRVKDLQKYRTNAAERYKAALKKLAQIQR